MAAISKLVARLKHSAPPAEISRSHDQQQVVQCVETITECQNQHTQGLAPNNARALTAATASPDWLRARDRYIDHLTTCRACHAPTDRYCANGAELRQQYKTSSMEPTP
jgi:hypothetical protein